MLVDAFPLAAAGTLAEGALLLIEQLPIRVHCTTCHAESDATPNRLLCASCGDFRTQLISGDEMLLASVRAAPRVLLEGAGVARQHFERRRDARL